MKSTCTVFLIFFATHIIFAQDTIQSLVITEARIDWDELAYIEVSNMGDEPIQLNQFEIGKSISNVGEEIATYQPLPGRYFMLPDRILQPGESFLICTANDYGPEQFALGKKGFPYSYPERANKLDLLEEADLIIHLAESDPIAETDRVSENWQTFTSLFGGQAGLYLEQHFPEGDSAIIDVVNIPKPPDSDYFLWSVAGVPEATRRGILVRRFVVKQGNPDFSNARGVGEDDSEWMVIPLQGGAWRKTHWTAGNHLDAKIDETTLESNIAIVDYPNRTITVPWGILRGDDIMDYFTKKPGIAWNYHCSTAFKDSLSQGAKNGDQMEVFGCGNNIQREKFTIIVSDPPTNANWLIPIDNHDPEGSWRNHLQDGILEWPRITRHNSGTDTIWGHKGGLPFATRIDSLLKRLEKAPNANWEFEWVDGIVHPDLKNGDILKVTAENGEIKEYYIAVKDYEPGHNAYLSSITWPDIPDSYIELYGWTDDTIPNFDPGRFNYQLKIPYDYNQIPALIAKTEDINATVEINRATSLTGMQEIRTISFKVTAEDDSTTRIYTVELIKEIAPENIQPFSALPFLSEVVFQDQWQNGWIEICNPGNQPLDLSNYMFAFVWGSAINGIEWNSGESEWSNRYLKYIPGYKWVNEDDWAVDPGTVILDLNVNPIVKGGDVFVAGQAQFSYLGPIWWATEESDILFDTWHNPWGETYNVWSSAAHSWSNATWYLYKILNDSIKLGLKAANDPNDFELIETFGHGDNTNWNIGGQTPGQLSSIVRKPEYHVPKSGYGESFGTSPDSSEWTITGLVERQQTMPGELHYFGTTLNLGTHIFNKITNYMSTVSSVVYKVSEGYSLNEKIWGITTGTTVESFLNNLIKADTSQVLTMKNFNDGTVLNPEDLLSMNDTLIVLSADSTNTTKYILEVTKNGLSSNALLTSSKYDIFLNSEHGASGEPGQATITGFDYGTSMRTIFANLNIPAGAMLSAIDNKGAYLPLKQLNYNNQYVPVTVNPGISLEVIAEDGITAIIYQLIPDSKEDNVFVLSDVYSVSQKNLLIEYVPRSTNVHSLLANLVPSAGATIQLVNKLGQHRTDGKIYQDDKIVVTSANGIYSKVYFISMLAEKYIPKTTYLAYILSDVYHIDQVNYIINGASSETSVIDFHAKISPAVGASAVLADKDGTEKTSGNITGNDMVRVTSLDGKMIVYYTFGQVTYSATINNNKIEVFPNPTDGKIYIKGINTETRITVYNALGSKIREIKCKEWNETISLEDQPSGMYLFHFIDDQKVLESYKIIKR